MSKSAKLENKPRTTGIDDYRAWGQKTEELLLEIGELLISNPQYKQLHARIDHFLLTGELPTIQ